MNHHRAALAVVVLAAGFIVAQEPRYVGVDKCAKMCHKSEKKGNQLGAWKSEKHPKAYLNLASDKAKEIAAKAGVTGDPQKSETCLKCHSTAFGVKPELIDSTFKIEEGVQCEACHGPGSKYMKLSVMKDKAKAVEAGLIEPDEKVCLKCHNETAPGGHALPFNFAEMVKEIAHPNPAKAGAAEGAK